MHRPHWLRVIAGTAAGLALLGSGSRVTGQVPPLPIGLDAYRQWDRWPLLRTGMRTYMRSTYDRRGGNEGADASHFLYQLADDDNVTLDIESPGILTFVRTNHWHGSPWRYLVDGRENLISESSTADPGHPVENSTFLPPGLFVEPLAYTWSTTRGADLNWTPIPFERSFRMGYSRTHYGTGYYIWHQFVPGTRLSQPIRTWRAAAPPMDVVKLLNRSGSDLLPAAGSEDARRMGLAGQRGRFKVDAGRMIHVVTLTGGPNQVRSLSFDAPRDQALALGRLRLRITWDGRADPSVDAPLALFFGAGTLYNRENRRFFVKAFPVNVEYSAERVTLRCFFPMPFRQSARIELVNDSTGPVEGEWSVRAAPPRDPIHLLGYFHAMYRDHPHPMRGEDLTLLDTAGIEGSSVWSGHLVGTSFIFSHNANLGTLEGDPRFYFDDSQTPQAQGTGTEEWCGGGDYWGGLNMTLPLAGHPVGARNQMEAKSAEDKVESAYRFLLADVMPFGRRALIRLEHGGTNESTEHYETVTYWYGLPEETLVRTDSLHVSDASDESKHGYRASGASAPYSLTSRYEWGVDTLDGREIYPAEPDTGRVVKGESSFSLKLDPRNVGVLLRRKLDYSFPNQRAEVWVSAAAGAPRWRHAGVWYLAGSNTCVYSNPIKELGATRHVIETSNRRFRDDEFLIPRSLTSGRSAIRVRIVFTPLNRPLYPGAPVPELAWSEFRYTAYCFVPPTDRAQPQESASTRTKIRLPNY
jgi:hypothetical protein